MNQLAHTRQQFCLTPDSFDQAYRLAELMAQAKLVPPPLQKSPADCLIVIMQAVRWQMDPFAVAQECSVIQGKPMYSGKLTTAVVNSRGNLTGRLSFEYSGAGDDRVIIVSGQLQGEDTPRAIEVRLGDVKTNNRVWQTQPDQQLAYHGARVWARRHTPELMLGVYSEEEFDNPPAIRRPPPIAPNVMQALPAPTPHDPVTGEVHDDGIPGFLDRRNSAASVSPASAADAPAPSQAPTENGAGDDESRVMFIHSTEDHIEGFDDAKELGKWWNSQEQKKARRDFGLNAQELDYLVGLVTARRDILTGGGNGK